MSESQECRLEPVKIDRCLLMLLNKISGSTYHVDVNSKIYAVHIDVSIRVISFYEELASKCIYYKI